MRSNAPFLGLAASLLALGVLPACAKPPASSGASIDSCTKRVNRPVVCANEPIASLASVSGPSPTIAVRSTSFDPVTTTTSVATTETSATATSDPGVTTTDATGVATGASTTPPTRAANASTASTTAPAAGGPATLSVGRAPQDAAAAIPAANSRNAAFVQRVIVLTNRARAGEGISPVASIDSLTQAAWTQSADQAAVKAMGHIGNDGSTLSDRATQVGYAWRALGENVAVGYATADDVMASWLASSDHRANILNPMFSHIGVAVVAADDGTLYWTMDLGAPA